MEDKTFECLVTRATLDAFWSRSSKTVAGHVREVKFMIKYGGILRFDPFPPLGPWPLYTHLGMLQALMVVMRSREKGRGDKQFVQHSTARKARGTLTILWETSPIAFSRHYVVLGLHSWQIHCHALPERGEVVPAV